MRGGWAALVVAAMMIPGVSAGLGAYDDAGWPINVDGESTNPDNNRVGPATVYPYYPVLTAEVQRLANEYPDIVRLHSIGKSTIGLDLWMLEIADFASPDAIPMDEREVVWVDGGTHSNEYSGVYFTLAVAQFIIEGYGDEMFPTWIVENRHTWILPMVNPDGSNAMGRLNANLVNINRNYPVVWDGVGNDMLMNNRGPEPASEVETQLTIEWYNKTQPDYFAGVHCCGTMWLYPYGEEGVDPPFNDYTVYERVCDEAMPDVRDDCGPIWSTIYPASGSSVDTVYEYTGAISFGYEMSGRGALGLWGQPFTVDDVAEQEYESWDGLMYAFEKVHLFGAYPVVLDARASGDGWMFTFANAGFGNLTHLMISLGDDGPWYGPEVLEQPVAPGTSFDMWIPEEVTEPTDLVLHYVKREMAAPEGLRRVPVSPDGWLDPQADSPEEYAPTDSPAALALSDGKNTPFAFPLVAAGLLGAAFWRRR